MWRMDVSSRSTTHLSVRITAQWKIRTCPNGSRNLTIPLLSGKDVRHLGHLSGSPTYITGQTGAAALEETDDWRISEMDTLGTHIAVETSVLLSILLFMS